ncbi:hypothetical protein [Pseudobacillus badius]|uniref:hypothetical protein n=1 Tax=Bacillus badius TaxID=1455 RepID=UPI0007B09451|nr:hypothetical protein [Bacillus badius]KZN99802.1 hypothetical protein A4244_17575 [Bacillus badius]OCS85905.1 hypothetical protein A6M11_17590 [Bacillus badius]OVE51735.1 hypothetical protein B1A98_09235 [Bacillus badius]TDW03152.1 hypothetical protein B0G66_10456 [Bacillus badius]UAT32333.1 hypothetical protein K7T73_09045 [Bacillus badius]
MKTVVRALIGSFFIHLVYYGFPFVNGYVKTVFYQPELSSESAAVSVLQNDVAFGGEWIDPFAFSLSFFSIAALCGLLFTCLKKASARRER